jgi:hypothetical protein
MGAKGCEGADRELKTLVPLLLETGNRKAIVYKDEICNDLGIEAK